MNLAMSTRQIVDTYRKASDKQKCIAELAMTCDCNPADIREILLKNGIKVGARNKRDMKKLNERLEHIIPQSVYVLIQEKITELNSEIDSIELQIQQLKEKKEEPIEQRDELLDFLKECGL